MRDILDGYECRRHFGGGAKAPQPTPPPTPPPKEEDPAIQQAAAEALRRKQKQRGYRSTVLSNALLSDDARTQLQAIGAGTTMGS